MPTERKTIYSKEQRNKDERTISETEHGNAPLNLAAFKRLMVYDLCSNTNVISSSKIGCYTLEEIERALANPRSHYKVLVETSQYLMSISPFYMRINNYFSKMGLFNYCIDTYDVKNQAKLSIENYQNDFQRLNSQLEKMNLKHEFAKIMSVLPSEDLFCGLIFEDGTDFFIMRIPSGHCELAQIQDGVYNFRIALSRVDPIDIGSYPDYFKQAYLEYRNKENYLDGWYIPPADKQICIKLNESQSYPLPLMIMLAKDIFDIDTYKKLKLQKARVDNYKAIVVEIPIDESSVDKPLLTEDTISVFAEMNKANMPNDVGLLHAVGKVQAISFKDNTNNTNNLSDSIENLYDASGVPSTLFNGSTVSSAMKLSIENDASIIYGVYRQLERYMNRFIKLRKFNRTNYKFAFRIHDSTIYNKDVVSDMFLKASEHGLPFKMDYAVSLGLSQNRMLGNLFSENIALELHNCLIPLPTSYTMSADDVGRPTNKSKGNELSDSGEQTNDTDQNLNR